jgi:hypothetical protein
MLGRQDSGQGLAEALGQACVWDQRGRGHGPQIGPDQDDGDIVWTTVIIGQLHQPPGSLLRAGVAGGGFDLDQVDRLPQPIAAQQDLVARAQGGVDDVYDNIGTGAKRSGQDVALRMLVCLLWGQDAFLKLLGHPGVVAGQDPYMLWGKEVCPAVAYVGNGQGLAVENCSHYGSTHLLVARLLGQAIDLGVGHADGPAQGARHVARRLAVVLFHHTAGYQLAGRFPRFVAPNAVGDQAQHTLRA